MGKVSFSFDLNDEYNTSVSAGVIDNTSAIPGPGVRKVIDTENKISLASSQFVNAGGKVTPAWGDPALFYASQSRLPGKLLIVHFNFSYAGSGGGMNLGFSTDQTAAMLKAHGIYISPARTITIFDNNTQDFVSNSTILAGGTNYYIAISLRSMGAFYYIKGGVFTKWTLIWISNLNSSASLYPSLNNKNVTYISDLAHISSHRWLPSPIASDGFANLGITDGLGHAEGVASSVGLGGSGFAWTGATWSLQSGKIANTPNLGSELSTGSLSIGSWYAITATQTNYFYSGCVVGDTFRAVISTSLDSNNKVKVLTLSELFYSSQLDLTDAYVDITMSVYGTGKQSGLVLRLDSVSNPQNFILIYHTTGDLIKVVECVNGIYSSDILSVSRAFAANKILRVDLFGSVVRVYSISSTGAVSVIGQGVTNILSGSLHGLFSTNSINLFDNFAVYQKTLGTNMIDKYAKKKSRVGAILLTFDDGRTSTYTEAFSYMQTKGMVGTAYITTNWPNTASYVTWSQLQTMNAAGWSIANHTVDHASLASLNSEQINAELVNAKSVLDSHGLTGASMHVAYPFGTYNSTVFAEMTNTGMLTGRSVDSGVFDYASQSMQNIIAINTAAATTAASLQPIILDAINLGKIVVLVIHDIKTSPVNYDWTITEFRALIDWMATQGIKPITINQLYSKMVGAR